MIDFHPIVFKDQEKEKIQRIAYNKWAENDCQGTMEIATGVGKTLIGLMAIQQEIDAKWWIIVPKIDLQEQWIAEIKEHLKLGDNMIGRVGNGYNETDKDVIVAIVNSVRDKELEGNLIMDEMHRYGSEENFKFLTNGTFKKVLGLTATAIRQDGAHQELFKVAPLVYSFSQKEAIDRNILAKFELINIMVGLSKEERLDYMTVEHIIKRDFSTFNNDFQQVQDATTGGGVMQAVAFGLLKAFSRRRSILLNANSRIAKTVELIENNPDSKILVFCEFIKTADKIVEELEEMGIVVGKYHSGMDNSKKKELLEHFRNNICRVMVSVKSLDEGTNIPDCDMAIITAGTRVERQMIQRLGRVLRAVEGKKSAQVYQLYIPNSPDYKWMRTRLTALIKNAEKVTWLDGTTVIAEPEWKEQDPKAKMYYAGTRFSSTSRGVIKKPSRELVPGMEEIEKIVRKHKPAGGVFSIFEDKVIIRFDNEFIIEVIK